MTIPDNVKFVVLDTETTCAAPDRGVCEVGFAVIDEDFNVLAQADSLIDPQRVITPGASGVHGLTNADVADAPTLAEFFSEDAPGCYGRKIEGPVVLIGHRIGFDAHTIAPFIDGEVFELCTLRWVRRLYPEMDNHKLSTTMFALGLPRPENAHRVMSDVYSAMYLVQHICQVTRHSLRSLAEASQAPFELAKYPFGKHQGESFSNVPKSYLRWARDNLKDIDQDMQHTINLHLNRRT